MTALLPLLLALLVGCADDTPPLKVGVKPFTEQRVLGEVLRQLVLQSDREAAPLVTCEDSWDCQHRLQRGDIHVMVDYTGTGLSLIGAPTGGSGAAALDRAREAYGPLGVEWLAPLGFGNGYRVLVPSWRATALSLADISDLEDLDPLRIATPPEFTRRPTDGLAPMLRRYGLTLAGDPLVIADPGERFQAVLDGRADVAIGYATDGASSGRPLVSLEDDLGFFPTYDAVMVANGERLADRPGLRKATEQLAGRLTDEAMQGLNYRVDVDGYPPRRSPAPGCARRGCSMRRPRARGSRPRASPRTRTSCWAARSTPRSPRPGRRSPASRCGWWRATRSRRWPRARPGWRRWARSTSSGPPARARCAATIGRWRWRCWGCASGTCCARPAPRGRPPPWATWAATAAAPASPAGSSPRG
jgi:osmoprotectant transport system substrate-binding protein